MAALLNNLARPPCRPPAMNLRPCVSSFRPSTDCRHRRQTTRRRRRRRQQPQHNGAVAGGGSRPMHRVWPHSRIRIPAFQHPSRSHPSIPASQPMQGTVTSHVPFAMAAAAWMRRGSSQICCCPCTPRSTWPAEPSLALVTNKSVVARSPSLLRPPAPPPCPPPPTPSSTSRSSWNPIVALDGCHGTLLVDGRSLSAHFSRHSLILGVLALHPSALVAFTTACRPTATASSTTSQI